MPKLPDILPPRAKILFVGINPSLRSGEVGHHFASRTNPFWRLLHASGLIPEPLTYEEDVRLVEFGLGLTNLCERPTRSAAELRPDELAKGARQLRKKIHAVAPEVVAFVGLTLYQRFFGLRQSGGAGEKPERIGEARVFVVPNPSGLNASFPGFEHKKVWFDRLRAFADEVTASR